MSKRTPGPVEGVILVGICAFGWCALGPIDANAQPPEEHLKQWEQAARARAIHFDSLVFDGHNDLPWQYRKRGLPPFDQLDIRRPVDGLHTDIPRLRAGGVGAQFWSVYVPVDAAEQGTALLTVLEQIALVKAMIREYPETFALALTADDVVRIRREGRIASLIGIEGGHCIENSLNVLRQLHAQGARYMTLTHSANLDWADSATDEPRHGGLTEFGEAVVREMNRLGMLVDLSHVSDDTMRDALRVTRAPVIFSHSSARALADHPRNVPDDILRMVADNGGVVMVNFYPAYVSAEGAKRSVQRLEFLQTLKRQGFDKVAQDGQLKRWDNEHPVPECDTDDVLDHIAHIAKVAGVDHVGLGSDYDGIGTVPRGLEDVSTYPRISEGLLRRGFDARSIRKILGENALRVLRAAARASVSAAPSSKE